MIKLLLVIYFLTVVVRCQNIPPPLSFCQTVNWITTKVVFTYFDEQAFMTVVDVSGLSHSLNVLSCEGAYYFRPIRVYNSIDSINFGSKINSGSLSTFPTTHGYFVRAKLADVEEKFVEKLSNFNPRTNLMFSFDDADAKKSKEWLKIVYEKYKILNVAVVCYVPKMESLSVLEFDVIVCFYNPFSEKLSDFLCLSFDLDNMKESLMKMKSFLRKRIENLQGFKLKVNIFEYKMKSVAVYSQKGELSRYTYPDGELLSSIAKNMNFTPVYLNNFGEAKYGFQFQNGTFSGSLADLEYDRADLVANPRLIAEYNTTKSIFLQPITMTKLFFTIKKRETNRIITITVFEKLDSISRCASIMAIVLFPVIYWAVYRTELSLKGIKSRDDKVKTILYVFGLLNSISMKHTQHRASQIVVVTILFAALMSAALFQGTILKDLNTICTVGKISKIDQLFEQNFTITMQPALTYAFQGQGEDKITKKLNELTRNISAISMKKEEAIAKMATDPKFTFLLTDLLTGNFLDQFYDNETGENYFEAVPESAFQFYIAMMAPKASHFIDRFNQIINIYVQTGLYQYHTQKAIDDNEKIWIHRIKNGLVPKEKSRSLRVSDLQALFKLYFCLIFFCCVAFFFEVIIG